MKKRILIVMSAIFVFGLFGAMFTLSGANTSAEKTEVSCPMQKSTGETNAGVNHQDSCCGMADCCKNGKCSMGGACCKDKNYCPLKEKRGNQSTENTDMSKVNVVSSDGADCCQPGADCCKGGACCRKKS